MAEIIYSIGALILGAAAGFINVLAGGGSVFVIAGLIFAGLSPSLANGTIRFGLLGQTATAILAFKRENIFFLKQALLLGLVAVPGAILGANLAVGIEESLLRKIFVIVMIFVMLSMILPDRTDSIKDPSIEPSISPLAYILMFFVGLYGGFIQAGVGFLIMAILNRFSTGCIVQINFFKVFIVFMYTIPAIVVFTVNGLVDWHYASLLAAGYGSGAWMGAKWSMNQSDKSLKFIVAAIIALLIGKMCFFP